MNAPKTLSPLQDAAVTPTKRLIVNADDLGLSPGVNRGILEAHLRGVVSSSTLMVNMPSAPAGAALVRAEAPRLGLGLHLNLSHGRPLLPPEEVPSLVRADGRFVSVSRGLASARCWRPDEVRAELAAQLARFTELAGELPDHLDSHQLVGSFSSVCREAMLDLSDAHRLPVRRGGRAAFRGLEREAARRLLVSGWAPPFLRPFPWRRFDHIYDRTPPQTDHFEMGFFGPQATVETLLRIVQELPEGVTELVCHPGYLDAGADGYGWREAELAALTDPRVSGALEAAGVLLTTFGALARAPEAAAGKV